MAVDAVKDSNREKALNAALSQIERQFGKGSMMRLGEKGKEAIPAISTGSLGLDIALGIGGLPRGRIVEIYDRSPRARPHSPCRSSRNASATAAPVPSSTRSMRLTRSMRAIWVWTLKICWSASPIPANRHWKSAT